ncbi:MAG: DUF2333 family protein [Thiohalocapsa sp.]
MNTDATTAPGRRQRLSHKAADVVKLYDPRTWKEKGLWWTSGLLLVTATVIVLILGFYWSQSPDPFDVRERAIQEMTGGGQSELVTGSYTTAAAIGIADTLLRKPGGYLSNDIMPPGLYLDNIPNWEYGALTELRDLTDALRNRMSRSQSQSLEDPDLQTAEPAFNYDSDSWVLPSTESEYKRGIEALENYFIRLADEKDEDGQFFARADNLAAYLEVAGMRLGSLANRLSHAAGKESFNMGLAGETAAEQSTPVPETQWKKTPWLQIDDVLFEARGYAWALLNTLEAMEIDFKSVLEDKNAVRSVKQIIRELKETQRPIWSPIIMNGIGFGPMANHSLVMASYLSRANAGVIDLRKLLEQG